MNRSMFTNPMDEKCAAREIARVHPDNTLELVHYRYMHQQLMLTALCGAWVHNLSRHHGAVYSVRGEVRHLLFRGLRINLKDDSVSEPCKIYYRKADRKIMREELRKYETFLKMAPVMINAITPEGLTEIAKDIYPKNGDPVRGNMMQQVKQFVEDGRYVDAALMYAINEGLIGAFTMRYQMLPDWTVVRIKSRLQTKFKDAVVASTDGCFTLVERKEDQAISSSKWGYVIDYKGAQTVHYSK